MTVTGLTPVWIGTSFTPSGPVVIAVLMQHCGVGLMAFAVLTIFALPVFATFAFPLGRSHVAAFRRTLPQTVQGDGGGHPQPVLRGRGMFALSAAQEGLDFLAVTFQVASAFGSVWLSRRIRSDLGAAGRVLLIAEILVGRVGPLTLGFFLAIHADPRMRDTEAHVPLG